MAAAQTLSEARSAAAEVVRSGREKHLAEAAMHRQEALEAAGVEADAIRREAEAAAERVLADAHANEDAALTAVLAVLKGR